MYSHTICAINGTHQNSDTGFCIVHHDVATTTAWDEVRYYFTESIIWARLNPPVTTTGGLKKNATRQLTLTGFKARVLFVDDVNAALALDHFAITVANLQRFQRVNNFHNTVPHV